MQGDRGLVFGLALACACSVGPRGETGFGDGDTGHDTVAPPTTGAAGSESASPESTDGGSSEGDSSDESGGPKLDVGAGQDTGPFDMCKPGDELSAPGPCETVAPPDSFDPVLQWAFETDPITDLPLQSTTIPLVGNFTDDNGDGEIDLCDTPDVLLVADLFVQYHLPCSLYLLDGATGSVHWQQSGSEVAAACFGTPAFADIDGDTLPEIVLLYRDAATGNTGLKALEHDGTLKWSTLEVGAGATEPFFGGSSVAIADLQDDGSPEIIVGHAVFDRDGALLWERTPPVWQEAETSTAADLDGDGDLEVITGHSAYEHDGTEVFDLYPTIPSTSFPQIGNLDDDPDPEILLTTSEGIVLVEHDGTITFGPVRPTGVAVENVATWMRPATIHDFDGDDEAEWAHASRDFYAVYEGPTPADMLWTATVADVTGGAAGTAFDFLGDGVAEAMYADESRLGVYDGATGSEVLATERCSVTYIEYPVVADVDNDGSAEILVVSTICLDNAPRKPALQVFRDADDRWIQARRIWNQHAYHVTNVREDGTLPSPPVNNWETLNTFRTNAQIEGGTVCVPEG
jgi:hypothetical protein